MKVRTATVPMKATGMRQLMTLRASSQMPPIRSAAALTSPSEPGRPIPVNICMRSNPEAATSPPSLRMLSGVAMVTPSMVHLVMVEVHEKNRKARPARAGFKKFLPMPP